MMSDYIPHITVLVLLLIGATGCDLLGTTGSPESALNLRLDAPIEVTQQDSIKVQYHVINRRADSLNVTSGGCLALIQVYKDEEQVPIKGTFDACALILSRHTIAPNDTLTQSSTLRIELRDSEDPVAPGGYQLRAAPFIGTVEDQDVDLPILEQEFTVLEADL